MRFTNTNDGYWIITGANSGIGHALAGRLDRLNEKTILIDKRVDNLGIFKNSAIFQADLSNLNEVSGISEKISQYKIFCLINNAGVGFRGSLDQMSMERIDETVDVNVRYPVRFTKLLLDHLIKDKSVIINIASSAAYNPLPNMSIYSASKAFLVNWSESLFYELRNTNRVITFSPSGTFTNFQKNAGVKVGDKGERLLSASCVADEIIKAAYGRRAIVILGFKTRALLRVSRFLPRKFNIYLWGKLFEKLK